MGEPAKKAVDIRQFNGMATNVDSEELKPGVAEVQVNVNGLKLGQLEVRRGLREVRFDAN